MKKIISLVILAILILGLIITLILCGNGKEEPLDVQTNPGKDEGTNSGGGDLKIPTIGSGNDAENTWNKDGSAIGHPVVVPSE